MYSRFLSVTNAGEQDILIKHVDQMKSYALNVVEIMMTVNAHLFSASNARVITWPSPKYVPSTLKKKRLRELMAEFNCITEKL